MAVWLNKPEPVCGDIFMIDFELVRLIEGTQAKREMQYQWILLLNLRKGNHYTKTFTFGAPTSDQRASYHANLNESLQRLHTVSILR